MARTKSTASDEPAAIVFSPEKASKLGVRIAKDFEKYKADRKPLEEQFLRNARQVRGIYDPEILDRIPEDGSVAYPKLTRTKCNGTVARLMELLFPKTDKNWGVEPSPIPDLDLGDLQGVLEGLEKNLEPGAELNDDKIERAVREFSKERAVKMERAIQDVLDEINYPDMIRDTVRSGVEYSAGVVMGPLIRTIDARTWSKSPTGKYTATKVKRRRPYYEVLSIWDYYPDLSAKRFTDMDGQFIRRVMSRQQLRDLADRPDFFGDQIKGWLATHTSGNFTELWWEKQLRTTGDKTNLSDLSGRKYEAGEWWGVISGHELEACGIKAPGGPSDMVEVNLWVLDKVVIKCVANPLRVKGALDERVRPFHIFVYEEDDISLLGNGLPYVLRDSQMAVCEAARMMLDNASVVSGPMVEVDVKKLMPGTDLDIYAGKVWPRDVDDPTDNVPAVRNITIDSHIPDLMSIFELFRDILDNESALPPPSLGDMSGSGTEPYRTSSGMSMLLGNASLPIRDVVRNFDKFTVSFVNSLYYWLMQFSDDASIRGDFSMVAKGSTSLIAKEVRANEIDVFCSTLTPGQQLWIDDEKLLREKMAARDIPPDILVPPEEAARRQKEAEAETARKEGMLSREFEARMEKIFSEAFKNIALARQADATADATAASAILDIMSGRGNDGTSSGEGEGGSGRSAPGKGKPAGSGGSGASKGSSK